MNNKILLTTVSAGFILHSAFGQGALTPPGAPAPLMKTLEQVEPRIPISALGINLTRPGSYYVTTNLFGVAGVHGIQVETNNVTIDLNGFSLTGVAGAFHAITAPSVTTSNLIVRNGIINGWSSGSAISSSGKNSRLENLVVVGNSSGLVCNGSSVVRHCSFVGNSQYGLVLNGSGSVAEENVFTGNNAANSAGVASISVQNSNCRVENNHITSSGPAGSGILIVGSVTNNLIIRNSVFGGGANNFIITGGNITGPLITNTVSGFITNANPWANFSF